MVILFVELQVEEESVNYSLCIRIAIPLLQIKLRLVVMACGLIQGGHCTKPILYLR